MFVKRQTACFSELSLSNDLAHKLAKVILQTPSSQSIILTGKMGCGASMVARRLAGLTISPFRSPHHTVSSVGMIGNSKSNGEVHLAAGGILYLDNAMNFRKSVVEDVVREAKRCNTRIVAFYCPIEESEYMQNWHEVSKREYMDKIDWLHDLLDVPPVGDHPYFYIPTKSYAEIKDAPRPDSNETLRELYL